jgi:hypothetical protein
LWKCSDIPDDQHKLIFVHVFKTAGTSFRTFFDHYASVCRKATTIVSDCADVFFQKDANETMETKIWQSDTGKKCVHRSTRLRNGTNIGHPELRITTQYLQQHHIDILAGHLPLGVHEFWRTDGRNQTLLSEPSRNPPVQA